MERVTEKRHLRGFLGADAPPREGVEKGKTSGKKGKDIY